MGELLIACCILQICISQSWVLIMQHEADLVFHKEWIYLPACSQYWQRKFKFIFLLFPNITLLQEYRLQNYLSETKPINILCELFVSKKYSDQVFIGQLLQKLKSPPMKHSFVYNTRLIKKGVMRVKFTRKVPFCDLAINFNPGLIHW